MMKYLSALALPAALIAMPASAQSGTDRQEIKLCNNHNETVYAALALGVVNDEAKMRRVPGMPPFAYEYHGWFTLDPGECEVKRVFKYADAARNVLRSFHIYGETKGLFGGAIKKVWEGSDHRGCMKRAREKLWVSASVKVENGRIVANPCNRSDEFRAGMESLTDKNGIGQLYYNFGGR
ncbi:hypothetical protein GRI34_12970 [Erythrobacter aquimaris]|uniref:Uncharacterized protein n=1 Tax=Qipengyuania aquimaris TaxID=255984 RepID=A0A6I4TRV3_9SPHN|nr:hypothetical protein [Qipengyuania aquimaris]MXO97328.1 hypothetical protein [Qipengyuania aquimaris]